MLRVLISTRELVWILWPEVAWSLIVSTVSCASDVNATTIALYGILAFLDVATDLASMAIVIVVQG